jgi:hypothetical protein
VEEVEEAAGTGELSLELDAIRHRGKEQEGWGGGGHGCQRGRRRRSSAGASLLSRRRGGSAGWHDDGGDGSRAESMHRIFFLFLFV